MQNHLRNKTDSWVPEQVMRQRRVLILLIMAAWSCAACGIERVDDSSNLRCDDHTPGTRLCGSDIGLDPSIGYICSYGSWESVTDCSADHETCKVQNNSFICAAKDSVCETGTSECVELSYRECIDGAWQTVQCGDGETCSIGERGCVKKPAQPECIPGTTRCTDDVMYSCDADGIWDEGAACGEGRTCDDSKTACTDAQKPECQAGEIECHEQERLVCDKKTGMWIHQKCDPGLFCHAGECVECITGAKRCLETELLQECSDGIWVTTEDCIAGEDAGTCVENVGCVFCRLGDKRCRSGSVEECSPEFKWVIKENCSTQGKLCIVNKCG